MIQFSSHQVVQEFGGVGLLLHLRDAGTLGILQVAHMTNEEEGACGVLLDGEEERAVDLEGDDLFGVGKPCRE